MATEILFDQTITKGEIYFEGQGAHTEVSITCCSTSFPDIVELLIHMKLNHYQHLEMYKEIIFETLQSLLNSSPTKLRYSPEITSEQDFSAKTLRRSNRKRKSRPDHEFKSSANEVKDSIESVEEKVDSLSPVDTNFEPLNELIVDIQDDSLKIKQGPLQNEIETDLLKKKFRKKPRPSNEIDEKEKIKCLHCDQICTKSTIHNHERRHKNTSCPSCKKSFTRESTLKQHILKFHPDVASVLSSTKRKSGIYLCKLCNQKFGTTIQLRNHLREHNPEIAKWPCRLCAFESNYKENLHQHMAEYHVTGSSDYNCQYCQLTFQTKFDFLQHCKKDHPDQIFDIPEFIAPTRIELDKLYPCNECQKTFVSAQYLAEHIKMHGTESHICPHCGKIYGHFKGLSRHIYFKHTNKEKYSNKNHLCPDCGAGFNNEYHLNAHRGNVHGTGEINFTCEHCAKGFFRQTEYRIHLRKHSDIRPFICNDCGKAFKTKNVLKLHFESSHMTAEKNTRCLLCEMMFKNMRHVSSHIRKVHKMSLAQAHEVVGLPYKARPVWNSVARRGELRINKKVYRAADISQFKVVKNVAEDE